MTIERIKFRGKATKRFQILTEHDVFLRTIEFGQWVTTDDFIGAENTALANSDADRFTKFFEHVAVGLIDPATVSQWTGLVDSKGVEIYEGDVVESGNLRQWTIKWGSWKHALPKYAYEQRFGWYLEGIESKDTVGILPSNSLRVFGNIHKVTK